MTLSWFSVALDKDWLSWTRRLFLNHTNPVFFCFFCIFHYNILHFPNFSPTSFSMKENLTSLRCPYTISCTFASRQATWWPISYPSESLSVSFMISATYWSQSLKAFIWPATKLRVLSLFSAPRCSGWRCAWWRFRRLFVSWLTWGMLRTVHISSPTWQSAGSYSASCSCCTSSGLSYFKRWTTWPSAREKSVTFKMTSSRRKKKRWRKKSSHSSFYSPSGSLRKMIWNMRANR